VKLTYKCTHSFDGENDHDLVILYVYTPAQKGWYPTYDCAGEPPEEATVEVISMLIDGVPATHDQLSAVDENERLYDEMMLHSADCIADEKAAAAEYRNDMRKD